MGKYKMDEPVEALNQSLDDNDCDHCCTHHDGWGRDFSKKIIKTLVGVLLVYGIFYIGAATRNSLKNYNYIGAAPAGERTITITGYGKVNGNNDIALTNIGFSNINTDVSKAQADNKKVMDGVYSDLKGMGIADKDITSNYSIYPEYNYTQNQGQELKGYRVSNTLSIKIRELSKIPNVLNLAGKYGANQVGGLSFTIDDPENLKNLARDKALVDAQQKAATLAKQLGVRLVEVVFYNEYDGSPVSPMPMYKAMDVATGMGGGQASVAPEVVSSGSQDVAMNVNITYKIMTPGW